MMRLKLFRTSEDNASSPQQSTTVTTQGLERASTEPRKRVKSPFSFSRSFSSAPSCGHKQQHRRRLSAVLQSFEESGHHPTKSVSTSSSRTTSRSSRRLQEAAHSDIRDEVFSETYSNQEMAQYLGRNSSWSSLASETESRFSMNCSSNTSVHEYTNSACTTSCSALSPTTALSPPPPRQNAATAAAGGEKEKRSPEGGKAMCKSPSQHHLDICECLTVDDTAEQGNQTKLDMLLQENRRLREANERKQREYHYEMLDKTKALAAAQQEIKYLRRVISCTHILAYGERAQPPRRQSLNDQHAMDDLDTPLDQQDQSERFSSLVLAATGNDRNAPKSSSSSTPSAAMVSYERKLRILLDEIEAMQTEDTQLDARRVQLEQKNQGLKHALDVRDETIRQLEHELRLTRVS